MSAELKACPFCGGEPFECLDGNFGCFNSGCPERGARALSLEDWNTRPLEDALLARAEQGERDAQIWRHNAENWYASTEKAKSMVERLTELIDSAPDFGGTPHTAFGREYRDWQALVAEYQEGEK